MEQLCMPCPEGRVCAVKGMTDIAQSDPCPSAHICGFNTTSGGKYDFKCPAGYYCDQETRPLHLQCASTEVRNQQRIEWEDQMTSVDDPICEDLDVIGPVERTDGRRCYCPISLCPAGFMCYPATPSDTKFGNPCKVGYYCPEGTDPAFIEDFRCPTGTTSYAQAETITDCFREYEQVTAALSSTVFIDDNTRSKFAAYVETDPAYNCRAFPNPPVCEDQDATRRRLSELSTAQLRSNSSGSNNSWRPIQGAYGYSISSVQREDAEYDDSLQVNGSTGRRLQIDPNEPDYLGTPPDILVFRLPPFTLARLEFDLAGRLPPGMIYSDHYRIAIFVDGHRQRYPYPPAFSFDMPVDGIYSAYKNHRWDKTSSFALHIHSMRTTHFRIELQILHGLYTTKLDAFEKSMQMRILPDANLEWGPDRAHPGIVENGVLQRYVFVMAVAKDAPVALPLNLPRLLPSDDHYGIDQSYMAPYKSDNVVTVLEYSMMNYTLGKGGNGGIIPDPFMGSYVAEWGADEYWGASLLTVAPMSHLPYFSLCTRGVRFGRPPETDFSETEDQPFTIGSPESGAPWRARGNLTKCQCAGMPQPEFTNGCPPEGYDGDASSCNTYMAANGEPLKNIEFQKVVFENPSLGASSDQYHLIGDWVVGTSCVNCEVAPGQPYPRDAMYPLTGEVAMLPGWDSRVPLTWVLENPDACHLVSDEDTHAVGQWAFFASERYSDACDYIMTCMYEEQSEIYPGKPFWFDAQNNDMMFYISARPIAISDVSNGFCFPDLAPQAERSAMAAQCANQDGEDGYFAKIREYYDNEDFVFVQAIVDDGQRHSPEWKPHRVQLLLKYWQTRVSDELKKVVVKGSFVMSDYAKPEGTTLRGYEYDLRITFIPVAWIDVLDEFALDTSTYLLFYLAVDFITIFAVVIIWGAFRISTRATAPPKLNFRGWMKGFELNPVGGFMIVVVPIAMITVFLRLVMVDINPFYMVAGSWAYIGVNVAPSAEVQEKWLSGRIGIMILCLGFNLMNVGAVMLCPRKDMPGSIWRPGFWQRRHVLYTSIWLFIVLLLALEVSFSKIFSLYPGEIMCVLFEMHPLSTSPP